jgi:hypothetical protein
MGALAITAGGSGTLARMAPPPSGHEVALEKQVSAGEGIAAIAEFVDHQRETQQERAEAFMCGCPDD